MKQFEQQNMSYNKKIQWLQKKDIFKNITFNDTIVTMDMV